MNTPDRQQPKRFWLPDLCNGLAFLRLILLGIFIVITLTLLRTGLAGFELGSIGRLFLYTVWIVFASAVGLCQLRRFAGKLDVSASVGLAILWLILASSLCALAAYQFTEPSMLRTTDFLSMNPLDPAARGATSLFSLWAETVSITLILGCFVLRFLFVHHELQIQQRQLMQAKYDALQARIKPHFLFNSLNSIAALIGIDTRKAEGAVLNLSDLLRMTLGEKDTHSLQAELDLCTKYLEIEELRMGERMSVVMSVNPQALSVSIPTLCIQPLLENALLHGLQHLPEGGEIKLNIDFLKPGKGSSSNNEQNHILVIDIENPIPDTPVKSTGTGSALDNIEARLQRFYAEKVSVESFSRDGYFMVKIQIKHPDKTSL